MFRFPHVSDYKKIAHLAKKSGLLLTSLGESEFERMLKWLYLECPSEEGIQIIWEEDNEISAHFGATPIYIKLRDKNLKSAFASNIVIDPLLRKKSLFFPLQKSFSNLIKEKGYSFSYGLNTRKDVLRVHLASGWKAAVTLNVYVRPLRFNSILDKITSSRLVKYFFRIPAFLAQFLFNCLTFNIVKPRVYFKKIEKFDSSFSPFLLKWMDSQVFCAQRTAEVLNWRFSKFKDREYLIYEGRVAGEIIGYIVLRKMAMEKFSCLAIVDLICLPGDTKFFNSFLKLAREIGTDLKVDLIVTLFSAHSAHKKTFWFNGFIKTPRIFTVIVHVPDKNSDVLINAPFNEWFISWFDHDYV